MCGKEEGLGPEGLSQDWSPGPWPGVGSYRWSLLGKLSIEPVSEALEQRVPTSDNDTAVQALRAGRRSEQSRDSPSPPPQLLLGPSAKTQAWASPGECQCRTCRCWWSPRGPRLAWCSPKGPAEKGDWASGPLSPLPDLCDASQLLPHPRIQGPPPSPTLTLEGSNRPSGMRSRSAP